MASSVGLGVEISEDQIRAVQLRRTGRGVALEAAAAVPVPRGALAGGVVQDARLLADAVRRLVRENHIGGSSAVVGISGRAAASRVLELPPMRREEMRAVVAGEMEHYRMIPAGQGTFDFLPLGDGEPGPGGQVRLLLMAADKKLVDADRDALRLAGLQMAALEPLSLAASRAVYPQLRAGGVAVIVVGARSTELAVFHSGALQYCRQVDTGTLDLTPLRPDATALLTPSEESVDALARPEAAPPAPSLTAMAGDSTSTLLFELRRSLDFYHREASLDARVERVLLSVDAERLPDLPGELEETLGLPVSLCQPFQEMPRARPDPAAQTPSAAPAFAAAVGLALRGLGAEPEAPCLDLSDTGTESRLAKLAPRWLTYALAISALLIAISSVSWFVVGRALQGRERDLAAKKEQLVRTAALEQEATSAARRAQEAQAMVQLKGLPWSEIFFQVAQFVPRGVWVTDVGTATGTTLAIRGEALSTEAVAGLMDSLTRSPLFADPRMTSVRRTARSGRDTVSYEIKVTVVPPGSTPAGTKPASPYAPSGASPPASPNAPPAAGATAPGGQP